jgi:hypothetical protein
VKIYWLFTPPVFGFIEIRELAEIWAKYSRSGRDSCLERIGAVNPFRIVLYFA